MKTFALLFTLILLAAQVSSGAELSAEVQPAQMQIGEPFELQLQVSGAAGRPVRVGELPEPFELVAADSSQPGLLRLTLLASDTGSRSLSELKVTVGGETLTVPPVAVQVQSVAPDSAQTPLPLKPYREHPFQWRELLEYAWIPALLALGWLGWWLWRRYFRRRPHETVAVVPLLPPDEEATRSLISLRDQKYPARGMLKEFFSEYSQIMRRYVERRYQFPALEMTTFDLEREFEDGNHPAILRDRLLPSLRESDLVKFAKHVPDYRTCDGYVDLGFEIVARTRPVAEPAEEQAA